MLAMQVDKGAGHFIPKTIKIQFPPRHEFNGWISVDKMIIANTNEFEKGVLELYIYSKTHFSNSLVFAIIILSTLIH